MSNNALKSSHVEGEMSGPALTHDRMTLTYAGASIAIQAAVEKCHEIGVPECIAVVDANSSLVAFAMLDGAARLAREPAVAKAATAASLGMATGAFPADFGANLALASSGAITNLAGGVPIVVAGIVLGGIGVGSGTPEQDVMVAEAAAAALRSAIERAQRE